MFIFFCYHYYFTIVVSEHKTVNICRLLCRNSHCFAILCSAHFPTCSSTNPHGHHACCGGMKPCKRPPEQRTLPCHRSSHRALNLTPQDHLGWARHIASPAGALLQKESPQCFFFSFFLREIDSVAVHPINSPLSPHPRSLRCSRFWHGRQNPRRRLWMVGRGRAKRRRCAFVVGEECGNVPAPCQTSLKGVRPHSAGVGKPGRDGAHTGERGCSCIGLSGDIWKKRKKALEERKEKIQEKSVFLEGYITHLPLSYDPPSLPLIPTPSPYTHTHPPLPMHKVSVRVCAWVFVHALLQPPPPPPPPPVWVSLPGLVCSLRGWGVRACTVQLPVWPPHGGQRTGDAFDAGAWAFLSDTPPVPPQQFIGHADVTTY